MKGTSDNILVLTFKGMSLKTPESKAFKLSKYYKLLGKYGIYTEVSPAQPSVDDTWVL